MSKVFPIFFTYDLNKKDMYLVGQDSRKSAVVVKKKFQMIER